MLRISPHLTYFLMQAFYIGGAGAYFTFAHAPLLWQRRRPLLLVTAMVVLYGSALDAWAVRSGWGWFDPRLVSGIWFGDLLLEEITFWVGTAAITTAGALVLAEGLDWGVPWWALPVALVFPSWLWMSVLRSPSPGEGGAPGGARPAA